MDPDFWRQRWREGRIGFHQERVTPLLEQYWDSVGVPAGGRVFVPLSGKSLDMAWLAARGHRVLGVELSPVAVRQFFDESGLVPDVRESPNAMHYSAGEIDIIEKRSFYRENRKNPLKKITSVILANAVDEKIEETGETEK